MRRARALACDFPCNVDTARGAWYGLIDHGFRRSGGASGWGSDRPGNQDFEGGIT
jgi:hypothetical protein